MKIDFQVVIKKIYPTAECHHEDRKQDHIVIDFNILHNP